MLTLIRPGDWLVLALAGIFVVALALNFWGGERGDTLIVRARGKLIDRISINQPKTLSVQGPLGTTLIEIEPGRARVKRDPSPRQLCVKQGWLTRAGEAALCLPNQVSIEIGGSHRTYDSLAY